MLRTEKEKMLAGELYTANDPEIQQDIEQAQRRLREFNSIPNEDYSARFSALQRLMASVGPGVTVRSPFFCDYGFNIRIGARGFVNYNCVFLDVNPIVIGDDAQIGPSVQIYTAGHPLALEPRRATLEFGRPSP